MAEATEARTKAGDARAGSSVLALLVGLAVLVLALDQTSKHFVVENLSPGVAFPFIGELLQLRFVRNAGAAFSLGVGYTWIFSIVASVVTVLVIVFARRIRSRAWAVVFGLLLGGTVGNLVDRLFREPAFGQGHVIDFLQLYAFPAIFNIADIAVVSSMGLFILLTLRGVGLDGRRASATRAESAATASPTD